MNKRFVDFRQKRESLKICPRSTRVPLTSLQVYINDYYKGSYPGRSPIALPLSELSRLGSKVTLRGLFSNGTYQTQSYRVKGINWQRQYRDFQPGDILVASDNVGAVPPGLMGHAAIVINETTVIESVMFKPYIRTYPIASFLREHPMHGHFRPKNKKVGVKAKLTAERYLQAYQKNVSKGKHKPTFSLSPTISLNDPWKSVYCSKLIWLSYRYGPKIKMKNDFLLFTPQDLDEILSKDSRFQVIYKHPNFRFLIDS